jgi:hypothetical protein
MRYQLAVIVLLVTSAAAAASSTVPATAPSVQMRALDFRVGSWQWEQRLAKHYPAPSLTAWSGRASKPFGYEAAMALRGELPGGWGEVIGTVGGPVPKGSTIRYVAGDIIDRRITVRARFEQQTPAGAEANIEDDVEQQQVYLLATGGAVLPGASRRRSSSRTRTSANGANTRSGYAACAMRS